MNQLTPAEVTARAEPIANQMSGPFGGDFQTCTGPRQVQFFYDDPMCTPITDLNTRFLSADGAVLAQTRTYHPLNFGAQDGTEALSRVRLQTGVAEQQDLPHDPLTIDTGAEPDIDSAADEAWELEKNLVAGLWMFETTMVRTFQPYVDEWNRDGAVGATGDFINGVGNGVSSWWNSEKDFWGSAYGWLKSTTAAVGGAIVDAGKATWDAVTDPIGTAQALGRAIDEGSQTLLAHLDNLVDAFRALLTGDIDTFFEKIGVLQALRTAEGVIGEFGQLLYDAFQNGVEWLNSLIETLRRTPVLGLIVNSVMRVVTMMTPNFWAEMIGNGVGFVIPEIIIWAICTIIAALAAATGAGAAGAVAGIAARAAKTARALRAMINASAKSFRAIMQFLDMLKPIIDGLTALARKLRDSMREIRSGVVDKTQRFFMPTRYFRQRLDELARQGHGPQRHEGDVTDSQLWDRAYHGLDPMTGATVDYDKFFKKYGVRYNPSTHGTPPDVRQITRASDGQTLTINWNQTRHISGDHATKFKTPTDYIRAYEKVVESLGYQSFLQGSKIQDPVKIKMSDVFGPDFQARVKGYSVLGGQGSPVTRTGAPYVDTVFGPDAEIIAIFRKEGKNIRLVTMYPNP